MRIQVTDEYALDDHDPMQWQLYEYMEVTKKDGSKVMEWRPRGYYFSRLSAALDWIMGQLPRRRSNGTSLVIQDALRDIHGIAKEVGKYAERFEKAREG